MLVSYVLPEIDMEKGQLYEGWESYNRYLQHVISLRDIFHEDIKASRGLKASTLFCEILNQYQRYGDIYKGKQTILGAELKS
jgi:hypothetical protein